MANKKIWELPFNGNLSGSTILPIVSGLITEHTSLSDVTEYIQNNMLSLVDIPKLKWNIDNNKLYLWWDALNTEFLKYNPRIFLFHYKKSKKTAKDSLNNHYRKKMNRFVHPANISGGTNTNPNYKAFYGGFDTSSHRSVNNLITEFYCPIKPNSWSEIRLDPNEWFIYNYAPGTPIPQMSQTSRGMVYALPELKRKIKPINYESLPPLSAKTPVKNKQFKFAIAIDNPNFTLTNKQNPVIIGDLSDTFYYGITGGGAESLGFGFKVKVHQQNFNYGN